MQATHFERIQICCDDIDKAALEYSILLDQEPTWIGDYRLADANGDLYDQGSSAWFLLENTHIELFSSSQRNFKAGITGVVMGHHDHDIAASDSNDFTSRVCTFSDAKGGSFEEEQLNLTQRDGEGFAITVLKKPELKQPSSLPLSDTAQDIKRVDHLVLSSHDAGACISRFGEAGLGLRLALDKQAPQWGGRMLFFRCGKMTLEVMVPSKKLDKPDFFLGIAYQTDDINVSSERFKRNNIESSEVRSGRKPNTLVSTIKSHTTGVPTLLLAVRSAM